MQYSYVFVAVGGETRNIRLKVGTNDVLAKVSPNYVVKLIFLTAVMRDVPVCGQLKVCWLHFKQNYLKNIV